MCLISYYFSLHFLFALLFFYFPFPDFFFSCGELLFQSLHSSHILSSSSCGFRFCIVMFLYFPCHSFSVFLHLLFSIVLFSFIFHFSLHHFLQQSHSSLSVVVLASVLFFFLFNIILSPSLCHPTHLASSFHRSRFCNFLYSVFFPPPSPVTSSHIIISRFPSLLISLPPSFPLPSRPTPRLPSPPFWFLYSPLNVSAT